jgi:hypothetical protein
MKVKVAVLLAILSSTSPVFAKHYDWKSSTVIKIESQSRGTASVPIGPNVFNVPVVMTYYSFRTDDGLTYVAVTGPGAHSALNVTLNGHNGLRIDDGGHVHILDDAGKDKKLRIVERIAPKEGQP